MKSLSLLLVVVLGPKGVGVGGGVWKQGPTAVTFLSDVFVTHTPFWLSGSPTISGGCCHKYDFCRDKHVFLSQQKYACCKRTFLLWQNYVCRNKIFVATNACLSRQAYFCCDKRWVCRDKHTCGSSHQWYPPNPPSHQHPLPALFLPSMSILLGIFLSPLPHPAPCPSLPLPHPIAKKMSSCSNAFVDMTNVHHDYLNVKLHEGPPSPTPSALCPLTPTPPAPTLAFPSFFLELKTAGSGLDGPQGEIVNVKSFWVKQVKGCMLTGVSWTLCRSVNFLLRKNCTF